MIPERCADPSRLFVGIDVMWWAMVAFSTVCKATDDPAKKAPEMRPILCGWLAKLYGGTRPGYVAAFLDSVGPTWRHAETAHLPAEQRYKADRAKKPQEFLDEVEGFIAILKLHGIPCYRAEGWEADDVAATVTGRALAAGLDVALVTLDHDWRALCRDRIGERGEVYCWSYGRTDAKTIGPAEMLADKAHGLEPRMVPEMTALCGDGDNIKGVRGIGADKARRVLCRWGSVEGVLTADPIDMDHAEAEVKRIGKELAREKRKKPADQSLSTLADCDQAIDVWRDDIACEKYRRAICANPDAVRLWLTLARLDTHAPLSPPFDLDACAAGRLDVKNLAAVYRRNDFLVLADDVESATVAA
jgi:5'-3' exonuclease